MRDHMPIIILLVVQLLNGLVISAQRFFFPIYVQETLGLTAVVVSTFVSVAQAAGMVAAIVGGSLNDVLGRKWTLILGVALLIVSGLVYFVRIPLLIGFLWTVNGLAMTLTSLGAQGYLLGATDGKRLGLFSALYNWGFTLGGALGSPVAGRLLDSRGYTTFAIVLLVVGGLNAVLAVLSMPRLMSTRVADAVPHFRIALTEYATLLRRPRVWRLSWLRFLPTCYYGMSLVLIPLFIHAQAGTKSAVAVFVTVSQVVATLAQLVVGSVADRFGPRLPTLGMTALVAVAGFGIAGAREWLSGLVVFGVLGAAAAWSLSTLMPMLVADAACPHEHGRVLGALSLVWNLAMILSTMIGGALAEVHKGLPFAIAGLLSVVSFAVGFRFFGGAQGQGGLD